MSESRCSRFHIPVAVSTFAGCLGAGVVDALLVLACGHHARLFEALALSAGLYGTAGLLCAALLGWSAAAVLGAIPGGWGALREDEDLDARVCGLLLGGVAAGAVLAAGAGLGYGGFVSSMNSRTLATIASAGLALVFAVPAALVFLATWRLAARLARRILPRPRQLGRTGLVALMLAVAGLLAFAFALSRADWRVLDLGPFGSAAIALVLGVAHGLFWHGSALGKRLLLKSPTRIIRPAIALVVVVLLVAGSRIRETSPTYAAIGEGGLGLKFALKLARKATDRDGDGYSALFGGGDCDDSRADVYPGAEDIPGDGIDQNCEGGDAPLVAESNADRDETPAATATKPNIANLGQARQVHRQHPHHRHRRHPRRPTRRRRIWSTGWPLAHAQPRWAGPQGRVLSPGLVPGAQHAALLPLVRDLALSVRNRLAEALAQLLAATAIEPTPSSNPWPARVGVPSAFSRTSTSPPIAESPKASPNGPTTAPRPSPIRTRTSPPHASFRA